MSLEVPGTAPAFKKPALPVPNRGLPTTSSSSASALTAPNRLPQTSRGKVQLAPGHSPLDWARLTSTLKPAGYARITPSQLKEHRRRGDLWMALGGRVYNCTRYLDYHPGGPQQLMRGAGRDATQMFQEVHGWVNYESMMQKCMVGVLVPDEPDQVKEQGSGLE